MGVVATAVPPRARRRPRRCRWRCCSTHLVWPPSTTSRICRAEVDLEVGAGGVERGRAGGGAEGGLRRRARDAVAAEALRLLEGHDGLARELAVPAVGGAVPVAERAEPLLQGRISSPSSPGASVPSAPGAGGTVVVVVGGTVGGRGWSRSSWSVRWWSSSPSAPIGSVAPGAVAAVAQRVPPPSRAPRRRTPTAPRSADERATTGRREVVESVAATPRTTLPGPETVLHATPQIGGSGGSGGEGGRRSAGGVGGLEDEGGGGVLGDARRGGRGTCRPRG